MSATMRVRQPSSLTETNRRAAQLAPPQANSPKLLTWADHADATPGCLAGEAGDVDEQGSAGAIQVVLLLDFWHEVEDAVAHFWVLGEVGGAFERQRCARTRIAVHQRHQRILA